MSSEGQLNLSGVFMPKFLEEPLTLSSKRDRERRSARYIPPAPRPQYLRSESSSQRRTRLIHSRNDSSDFESSFTTLAQTAAVDGVEPSYFRQCFDVQSRLGFGSFGDVFRCKCIVDNKEYAIKKSRRTYNGVNDRARQIREVQRVVRVPPHPNVVFLEKAWEEDGHLFLQMELCSMSLNQYLEESHNLSDTDRIQIAWDVLVDILHALHHLHKRHLVHMDVKTDNILLSMDKTPVYKLGDFGITVSLEEINDMTEFTEGDSRYLAPEVMQGKVSTKADIFSLGLSILEIACHVDLPTRGELWHMLRQGESLPPPCDELLPSCLQIIVKQMICTDASKRPEVSELMLLPLIEKHNRKRQRSTFLSYVEKKFSAIKKFWNIIISFLASIFRFGGGANKTDESSKLIGNSTPDSTGMDSIVPTIFLNEHSFSDDDDFKRNCSKASSPNFASTPCSTSTTQTNTRSSARFRTGRFSRTAGNETLHNTSRNLLKEFEAVSENSGTT